MLRCRRVERRQEWPGAAPGVHHRMRRRPASMLRLRTTRFFDDDGREPGLARTSTAHEGR